MAVQFGSAQALATELEQIANHWEQFGADRQAAEAVRDALRYAFEGWRCEVPQHSGTCEQRKPSRASLDYVINTVIYGDAAAKRIAASSE